ncbi:MAG: hypothetical protein JWQ02_2534 [Capsulimonas sp.]|jgi:hypothetical protein|nr:hypothetical protein [Capsulimonas sp.]
MQSKKNTSAALAFALMAGVGALTAAPSHAATTIYVLPDIGTFPYRTEGNLAAKYSGDGFVNYYGDVAGIQEFSHEFSINYDYSKVSVQVDISGLAGQNINNASVSFDLLEGYTGVKTIGVTSFADPTGKLGYDFFSTPPVLGTTSFTTTGNLGSQSGDITALLQSAVANGDQYFAFQLADINPFEAYQYTTDYHSAGEPGYPNDTYLFDAPKLRLTVNSAPAVPEPSGYAAFAIGALALGSLLLRRRRATTL